MFQMGGGLLGGVNLIGHLWYVSNPRLEVCFALNSLYTSAKEGVPWAHFMPFLRFQIIYFSDNALPNCLLQAKLLCSFRLNHCYRTFLFQYFSISCLQIVGRELYNTLSLFIISLQQAFILMHFLFIWYVLAINRTS